MLRKTIQKGHIQDQGLLKYRLPIYGGPDLRWKGPGVSRREMVRPNSTFLGKGGFS